MSMRSTNRLGDDAKGCNTYLPKEEVGISFPPDRTALLVIDPVNDFLSEGGAGCEHCRAARGQSKAARYERIPRPVASAAGRKGQRGDGSTRT